MILTVNDPSNINLSIGEDSLDLDAGDTVNIGTTDYQELINKPSINEVELVGDLSSEDLGVADAEHTHVKADITDFAHTHTKSDVTDFAHTHTRSDVTDFSHTHVKADVTDFAHNHTKSEITDFPTIPTKTSDLNNDSGYITTDDIPPEVTDLGNIDPSEYEDDREVFLNTLLQDGTYRFVWEDGDDYELYVVVESMLDGGYVYQKYWSTEEGSKYQYHCTLIVEDDEVIERYEETYLTLSDASNMFSAKTHAHYDSIDDAMSVFDWCDTNDLTFDNAKPFILYTDTLNDKNWVIERYASVRLPKYRFIRVYDTSDASHFYMRSGSVIGNTTTWGSWEEYAVGGGGTVTDVEVNGTSVVTGGVAEITETDEAVKQQYQAESGYSYWRPLLVGKSSNATEGFTPSTVTDQTYTFKTLEVQPSTGTIRMGVASMFKGSYESKISPDILTADRTVTVPDKNGTMAMTSDIPTDTGDLTNSAGFITLADLPIYNGGVS